MIEQIENLEADKIATLKDLQSSVNLVSDKIRLGVNGASRLSVYSFSKWKAWDRTTRNRFKECFSDDYVNDALIGWFLHLPANTGFLDQQNAWVNEKVAGTVIAYSLSDSNNIWIAGNEARISTGEGIKFSLKNIHEIKTSSTDKNWACLMLLQ